MGHCGFWLVAQWMYSHALCLQKSVCVDCKGIYLKSHSTVGIILDENKPVWGGFQKYF